jgi:3-deoxy-manno-octulosonate cytidylyltransferase (CMP-KDO synthetase)
MLGHMLERCLQATSAHASVLCTDSQAQADQAAWLEGFFAPHQHRLLIRERSHCLGGSTTTGRGEQRTGAHHHYQYPGRSTLPRPRLDRCHRHLLIARQPNPEVLTPIYRLSAEQLHNHNVVKVLLAADGRGLFSPLGPAPCARCADVLLRWPQLPISPLEELEKLEQLRLIEAGIRIDALEVEGGQFSLDTPEQQEQARAMATGRSW